MLFYGVIDSQVVLCVQVCICSCRAGRNLPYNESCYLNTVLVAAAVHRGFGRRLSCHQVTNFLDLGTRHV